MPTIIEILNKLKNVIDGKSSREEVADWAYGLFTDDNLELDDDVKDLLYSAMLIDSAVNGPDDYLYPLSQIEEWVQEYSK